MHNGQLNENHISTRVRPYKNLKPMSSCYFHLIQIHFLKNYDVFIYTTFDWMLLSSLNIEFYGWKVRWDYNVVPNVVEINCHNLWQIVVNWFKEKNINKIKPKGLQVMSHVANTEDSSANFNTLNYPEESTNPYGTSDESKWESNFSTDTTQLTFTCSKSTTETLEKGVKYVQSW